MTQHYNDAWAVGGSGHGYTHVKDGTHDAVQPHRLLVRRQDVGAHADDVKVVGDVNDSDHVAVVATYAVPSTRRSRADRAGERRRRPTDARPTARRRRSRRR